MRRVVITALFGVLAAASLTIGCHAGEDDAAGLAGELSDSVRRQNAITHITRLYGAALSGNNGDRNAAPVKAIADVTVEKLSDAYLAHPEDNRNGEAIINLLLQMQDARSIPALVQALNWRSDVNETHATEAAKALRAIDIPDADKGRVIAALAEALEKVSGARGIDNRMRREFLITLGAVGDARATPVLTKIALAQTPEQNFLFNHAAVRQLGRIADPESIPVLIKGLYLFSPTNPGMRMNDVAASALVSIGRPALAPLVALLHGENEEANTLAQAYIEAVRERSAEAAEALSVEQLVGAEATFALGGLGFPEAFEPLTREARSDNVIQRVQAVTALARLTISAVQARRVARLAQDVYAAAKNLPDVRVARDMRARLIVVMRHTYEPGILPFLFEQADDESVRPRVREEAVKAYAYLATRSEAARLLELIRRERTSAQGGFRESFQTMVPALQAAEACDEDVACWIGKLGDSDKIVAVKAANMLGRLGHGNAQALSALVNQLGNRELEVRLSAIAAIDHIADNGSPEAVAKVDELRQREEGQSMWTNFAREALVIQARLRNRASQ